VSWKKIVLYSNKEEMGLIEVRTIFSLIWLATLCILNCSGQQTPSISFISPDIVTDIGLSTCFSLKIINFKVCLF